MDWFILLNIIFDSFIDLMFLYSNIKSMDLSLIIWVTSWDWIKIGTIILVLANISLVFVTRQSVKQVEDQNRRIDKQRKERAYTQLRGRELELLDIFVVLVQERTKFEAYKNILEIRDMLKNTDEKRIAYNNYIRIEQQFNIAKIELIRSIARLSDTLSMIMLLTNNDATINKIDKIDSDLGFGLKKNLDDWMNQYIKELDDEFNKEMDDISLHEFYLIMNRLRKKRVELTITWLEHNIAVMIESILKDLKKEIE